MTGDDRAPLLLLAPSAEKKTQLLLGRWGRDMARETATAGVMGKRYGKRDDWDQLLVQRRDWSHYWIAAAASTCFQWLKGCESAKGEARNFSYLELIVMVLYSCGSSFNSTSKPKPKPDVVET